MTDLPSGWATAEIGDLLYGITAGKNLKCEERPPQAHERGVIKVSAVTWGTFDASQSKTLPASFEPVPETRIKAGDFLFSRANTLELVGAVVIVRDDHPNLYLSDKVLRLDFPPELKPWLLVYLRSPEGRQKLSEVSSGNQMSMRNIGQSSLKSVLIPLPPLNEQCRIVAKIEAMFDEIDKGVESLQTARATLDLYRQSLLKSAFEGRLTADWRVRNADKLESSEALLARISAPEQPKGGRKAAEQVIEGVAALAVNKPNKAPPPGWSWQPILRLARQETGHTPSRNHDEYWDGDQYWIGIKDARAHHGKVIQDTIQKVTLLGLKNSSARTLPAGTVCLSRTASVGYVCIMGKPMATSQDFATWTCTPALEPHFLAYALIAEGDEIRRFGKGTTHTTIYFPEIRALHICLPSPAEQAEIVRLLDEKLEAAAALEAEIDAALTRADALRQSILKKAFSGQLVPQDPNDEPASALLERIKADRARASKAPGKRKATV